MHTSPCISTTTTVAPLNQAAACTELRNSPRYAFLYAADGIQTDGQLAAANIARLLGVELPSVDFAVSTPHQGTVEVRWRDGPTLAVVCGLIKRFQCDDPGGVDCDPWPLAFGGARFVVCHRFYSEGFIAHVIADLVARHAETLADTPLPSAKEFQAGQLCGQSVPGCNEDWQTLIQIHADATSI